MQIHGLITKHRTTGFIHSIVAGGVIRQCDTGLKHRILYIELIRLLYSLGVDIRLTESKIAAEAHTEP